MQMNFNNSLDWGRWFLGKEGRDMIWDKNKQNDKEMVF